METAQAVKVVFMEFVKDFKKYRYLLYELVKKDIKLKYRSSILGLIWTLLEPLLTALVLNLVFSDMMGRGGTDFIVYILTGRLLYSFFANGTKVALKSVRKHGSMISKVHTPKYFYPLASILSNYVIFLISLSVLVGAMIVVGVPFTAKIFLAVIPLTIILIMAMGVSLLLSALSVFFRDLEYIWTVAMMLIMYTCAIFYDVKGFDEKGKGWIFKCNPLYSLIVLFRDAVGVGGGSFARDTYHLYFSLIFSVAIFIVGSLVFKLKQDKFILYV